MEFGVVAQYFDECSCQLFWLMADDVPRCPHFADVAHDYQVCFNHLNAFIFKMLLRPVIENLYLGSI